MGDNKLFAKNDKEMESLMQTIRIYREDMGMEFGIENCNSHLKNWKKNTNNQSKRTAKSRIRTLWEKKTYNYPEILELGNIKEAEMKEKIKNNTSDER